MAAALGPLIDPNGSNPFHTNALQAVTLHGSQFSDAKVGGVYTISVQLQVTKADSTIETFSTPTITNVTSTQIDLTVPSDSLHPDTSSKPPSPLTVVVTNSGEGPIDRAYTMTWSA